MLETIEQLLTSIMTLGRLIDGKGTSVMRFNIYLSTQMMIIACMKPYSHLSMGNVVPGDKEMRYKLDKNTLNAEKNGHLVSMQMHLDM